MSAASRRASNSACVSISQPITTPTAELPSAWRYVLRSKIGAAQSFVPRPKPPWQSGHSSSGSSLAAAATTFPLQSSHPGAIIRVVMGRQQCHRPTKRPKVPDLVVCVCSVTRLATVQGMPSPPGVFFSSQAVEGDSTQLEGYPG